MSSIAARISTDVDWARAWRRWQRPLLLGNGLAAVVAVLVIAIFMLNGKSDWLGSEARGSWGIDPFHPYKSLDYGTPGAFFYSPAYAFLVAPLGLLPWPVFVAIALAVEIVSLAYLVGWRWIGYAALLLPVMDDLLGANINLAMTAAIVIGLERPVAWAFVLLTKVTPGIGVLWFAVRREWRNVAIALGLTAAIVVVTFLIAPDAWRQWISILLDNAGRPLPDNAVPIPLVIRLPIAAALVVYGARTNRPWLVPVAGFLGIAVIWREHDLVLLGAVAIWRRRRARSQVGAAEAEPSALTPDRAASNA